MIASTAEPQGAPGGDQLPAVLVADDHAANLTALEAILRGPELSLVTVTSGDQALQLAAAKEFAVILLDVRMPGLSGHATVQRLRQQERSRHTPVILLTALDSDERDVLTAYAQGAVDYLAKPYRPEVLRAKVRTFVELFRQREHLRRQEAALRSRERELDRHWFFETLESLSDGFLAFDAEWRFTHVNALGERVLGRPRAELLGKELWGEFPELEHTAFGQAYRKAMRDQVAVQVEEFYPPFDAWFEARAFPTPSGLSLLFRDISERKRHEEERSQLLARERSARTLVEEQKALLELIIEQSGNGIIVADGAGELRILNPAAVQQHGASAQAVGAAEWSRMYQAFTLEGDQLSLDQWPLLRALRGESVVDACWQIRRHDGSMRTLEGTATPLRTPEGQHAGGLLVTRDITEERRVRAQVARRARHAMLAGDVGSLLTRAGTVREMLQGCTDSMVRHLDAAFARIWTLDASGSTLELQASAGLYTHLDGAHGRVPVGRFKIGLIALEGTPHLTNDVPNDERVGDKDWARREGMVAFAGYPLRLENRVIGVLGMFARAPLETDVLEALAAVADSIALGVQRSRAEVALLNSEARYRLATRATKDAIWDWNLLTDEVVWNEGVESLFGHTLYQVPRVVTWWYEHVHPEDRERVVHGIHTAIDGGGSGWHDEYRFLRQDASYAVVTDRGFINRDASGKPMQMVGAMQDVTAERRVQQALRDSEAQFRTLAESIPHLAWMANADGHIFWYNQRWYEYTGTDLAQMEGWGWKSVHDPRLLDGVVARWRHSLDTGEPFELEFPLRRHDGVFRWHLTRATPVRDGKGAVVRWFGTNTDVDDQRSLRERQHFLAEASKTLATSLDYEATLRAVARLAVPAFADWAAVDMLGESNRIHRLAVEHSDPSKVALAWSLHEQYPPDISDVSGVGRVLRTGAAELVPDIPDSLLVAASRNEEHLRVARELGLKSYLAVPLQAGERVLGAISLVYAESDRKYQSIDLQLMEELASRAALAIENARLFREVTHLNANLEDLVRERTKKLEEANGELESFTYSVSHDLRAPLRHIGGFAQLLEKRSAAALDQKSQGYVKTIREAAQRGGELVDDLLAFSRLGRAELRKDVIDLSRLFDDVWGELRPEWEQRRVSWSAELLPKAIGDAHLVRAAVKNLVANALKYSRPREEATIAVVARDSGSEIEVSIQDNGVGFDMQYSDKLFGVFQRLHTSEQFEGTGIGLANVRRIIQRHGGRTWAEGIIGQGATFYFTLPKRSAEAAS